LTQMTSFSCILLVVSVGMADAATKGTLTMWTSGERTIEGSSCRFSDPRGGGLSGIPHGAYIENQDYCAVSADLYEGGKACGRCYKLTYAGQGGLHGTPAGEPDSVVVKVVDSGAGGTNHFDCHLTAYTRLTHTAPGIFPISFERTKCGATGPAGATVLQGGNPWSVIVLFSSLRSPVAKAEIDVDGQRFQMRQGFSAAWQAGVFLDHGPRRAQTVVSFKLQLVDNSRITIDRCFAHWPVKAGEMCRHGQAQHLVVASVLTAGELSPSAEYSLMNSLGFASQGAPAEETTNSTERSPSRSQEFLATRSP